MFCFTLPLYITRILDYNTYSKANKENSELTRRAFVFAKNDHNNNSNDTTSSNLFRHQSEVVEGHELKRQQEQRICGKRKVRTVYRTNPHFSTSIPHRMQAQYNNCEATYPETEPIGPARAARPNNTKTGMRKTAGMRHVFITPENPKY